MRLSLSYRKQGVGLTKRLDILREEADIFEDALARITGTNEQEVSFLPAMVALYSS